MEYLVPKGIPKGALEVNGGVILPQTLKKIRKLVKGLGATVERIYKHSPTGSVPENRREIYLDIIFEKKTYTTSLRSLQKGTIPWERPTDYNRWNKLYPKGHFLYRFKNREDKVIYIGKTSDLKSRFGSHFRKCGRRTSWVDEVCKIEITETLPESYMHLMEVYLILKYKPIFNTEFNTNDTLDIILEEPNFKFLREVDENETF